MDSTCQELEALAFLHAHVGISLVDREGRFRAVNDRYCEIVGRSRAELLKLSLRDVNFPDYHAEESRAIEELASGKRELFVTEKQYRSESGQGIWARITGKAIRSETGEVKFFLGTIEDISAQKLSEQGLALARSHLEEAEKFVQMGRWSWDARTGATEWSDELYQIFGVPRDRTPNDDHFFELLHPDDMLRVKEGFYRSLKERRSFRDEYRVMRESGEVRFIKVYGDIKCCPNGQPLRVEGFAYDITEQRRTEIKAREGDSRFQQVLDAIPDLVLVKGPDSRIFWANKAFREYYGMSNEELYGTVDAEFSLPEHTERYLRDDAYVFQSGRMLEIPQELVRGQSGEVRIFHTVKSPLINEIGKVVMSVGVSRDITEKLATEKAIEEQRIRLISSAKLSALGVMAGGIAHEINNPLGIIQGVTANLIQDLRDDANARRLPPTFAEGLRKIHDTSVRIAKVVRGLRFFSRSADLDPMMRADPSQIVRDTLELCAEKFRVGGIHLRIGDLTHTSIDCRPSEIGQVLLNLLQNSYDAVHDSIDPWVSIDVLSLDDKVVFKVCDSGDGIDSEVASHMMDPFYTTKEVGKGTGLGLSISKGIIESHGGNLQYLEGLPHTTFTFDLPLGRLR